MPDEHITNRQRHRPHFNVTGGHRTKPVGARPPVRAWRDFDWPVLWRNSAQAEADDEHVRRKREIRQLLKERALIVDMNILVHRSAEGHITTPLIGDDPIAEDAPDDPQHLAVKEELGREAGRRERHREEVSVGAPIGLVAVVREVGEERRPKCVPACIDEGLGKASGNDAVALLLEFRESAICVDQCVLSATNGQ